MLSSMPPGSAYPVGHVLAGKYRVESVLGEGGMGVVLKATHLFLDVPVAVKLMKRAVVEPGDEAGVRFTREARSAAKLKSENVARVMDFGNLDDGTPFLVIEHLNGRDLSSYVNAKVRLPVPMACLAIVHACAALEEAHALGIVHRDIKPSNLFVTKKPNGEHRFKVLDFGISKFVMPGEGEMFETMTNGLVGSPLYMSPEQLRNSRDIDARTDVWSLGATLYELLTGSPPFQSDSLMSLCLRVASEGHEPASSRRPEVPPELDVILERCLAKLRDDRISTVRELADALRPFARDEALPELPPESRGAASTLPIVVEDAIPTPSVVAVGEAVTARDPSLPPAPSPPGTDAPWSTTRGSGRWYASSLGTGRRRVVWGALGAAAATVGAWALLTAPSPEASEDAALASDAAQLPDPSEGSVLEAPAEGTASETPRDVTAEPQGAVASSAPSSLAVPSPTAPSVAAPGRVVPAEHPSADVASESATSVDTQSPKPGGSPAVRSTPKRAPTVHRALPQPPEPAPEQSAKPKARSGDAFSEM